MSKAQLQKHFVSKRGRKYNVKTQRSDPPAPPTGRNVANKIVLLVLHVERRPIVIVHVRRVIPIADVVVGRRPQIAKYEVVRGLVADVVAVTGSVVSYV